MKKILVALALMVVASTPLWAPPTSSKPGVVVVSSAPSGRCTESEIRVVKSTGEHYACLGSVWTELELRASDVDASNAAADELCLTYESGDSKFEWQTCAAGSSGTSTVQEGGTTATSTATILNFGAGTDVAVSTTVSSNDTVTLTHDYTEDPVNINSSEVTGTLPVASGGTGATTAAGARSNLGAAASGPNSDITSLTGLSTPLASNYGGTGTATETDDSVLVGSGSQWVVSAVPNCPTGNQLLYTTSNNTFACEADGAGAAGLNVQEEGSTVTVAARNLINFIGGAITAEDDAGNTRANVTLSQSPTGSTSVVGVDRTLTGGAGINIDAVDTANDLSANRSITTDSLESGFITSSSGTITCTSIAGAMKVLDVAGPVQFCDGGNNQRYVAYGTSTGAADTGDSAASFFQAGTLEVARGGTNSTTIGVDTNVLFNDGGGVGADADLSYNKTTNILSVGGVDTSAAQDNSRYLELTANSGTPTALTAPGSVRIFANGSSGSEVVRYQIYTGGANYQIATLSRTETFTNKTYDGASNDLQLRRHATDCTSLTDGVTGEPCYEQDANTLYVCEPTAGGCDTAGEWILATGAGSGDITAVGPGYASGAAFTDGVVSTGTDLLIWEGTTDNTNELTIIGPADPGADIAITLPSATGTLVTATDTGTLDWGGATSVEVPNAAAPTVNAAGEIAIDTTEDQIKYYGGAERVLTYKEALSAGLLLPAEGDDPLLLKAPYDMTITDIDCIVDPGGAAESVVIDIQECDATGGTCGSVDATITCDNDGAADDGAFSNAAIDTDDWIMLDIGPVTGTVSKLAVTVRYTVTAK